MNRSSEGIQESLDAPMDFLLTFLVQQSCELSQPAKGNASCFKFEP